MQGAHSTPLLPTSYLSAPSCGVPVSHEAPTSHLQPRPLQQREAARQLILLPCIWQAGILSEAVIDS